MQVIQPYYQSDKATLYLADCLEVMRGMPENSVDAIVCDPPAGISFMGKHWDGDKGGRRQWIAGMAEIFAEALRVLKPGGHAFVWALPRTSHWTATALEDAGFEIRDRVAHIFGSGFPKSLDVGKAIDKAAGAEREVVGTRPVAYPDSDCWGIPNRNTNGDSINKRVDFGLKGINMGGIKPVTAPATDAARQWDGWGTALKPAVEDWWLCRKPLSEPTVAANVLRWGTGGVNVGACRVEGKVTPDQLSAIGSGCGYENTAGNGIYHGVGGVKIPPHPAGRWPANLVLSHHPECRQVGTKRVKNNGGVPQTPLIKDSAVNFIGKERTSFVHYFDPDGYETCEKWECHPECAVAMLDAQSGESSEKTRVLHHRSASGFVDNGQRYETATHGDTGGASRYFATFPADATRMCYMPKASRSEREAGCEGMMEHRVNKMGSFGNQEDLECPDGAHRVGDKGSAMLRNTHPTVKPLALMRWLCRLITPPNGIILDPFMGSGTTGCAAMREGFRFIGIEREADYIEIAKRRIAYWAADLALLACR